MRCFALLMRWAMVASPTRNASITCRTWIGCCVATPPGPGTAESFAAISIARASDSTSTIWYPATHSLNSWKGPSVTRGAVSAVRVSSLILASTIAYDVLRVAGAAMLVAIGLRSLVGRRLAWFSTLAFTVDRTGAILGPRLRRGLERVAGGVMVGFGVKLATEAR